MATWPSTLPKPLSAGYGLDSVDQCVRTDMEAGAARVRRRSSARDDQIAVAWLFTALEMAEFRAWFDDPDEGAGGSAWILITLDTGDGGSAVVEARFVGAWKSERLKGGVRWRVTARLEVR